LALLRLALVELAVVALVVQQATELPVLLILAEAAVAAEFFRFLMEPAAQAAPVSSSSNTKSLQPQRSLPLSPRKSG